MNNGQNDEIFEQVNKLLEARKRICELIGDENGGDGIVGRLGEYIGAKAFQLGLDRRAGSDAVDSNNLKYEIKARTLPAEKKADETDFKIDRNAVDTKLFDFFLGIVLDQEYRVEAAYKAPCNFLYETVQKKKKKADKNGRYAFYVTEFRDSKECENVIDKIRQSWPR